MTVIQQRHQVHTWVGFMSVDTGLMTLSKTEFESIKAKLTDLPKDPLPRIMAIAEAISDSGIRQDHLNDAFQEVCRRL